MKDIINILKTCDACRESFEDKYAKDKKYCKVRDHCQYTDDCRGALHSICYLKYSVPKEITIIFHSGSVIIIFS